MHQRDELRQQLGTLVARSNHVAERFLSEMDFVEGLCELHPQDAGGWQAIIAQAWEGVEKACGRGIEHLDSAVKQAEALLDPIAKVAKTYTIHCIGHAHIDMNWMWSWPETVHTVNDTFSTVLTLMEEFDDFCFTQSQASIYEIVERYNPELLRRIASRVKEGRWEVVASHWVEGDHNMASGESLTRHLLYTRRYLKKIFDLSPDDVPIEWSPDTFGHAHTIPAVNQRGGVRRMYLCRGGAGWAKPPVFWFQAPDGSKVLVNHETTWYNDIISPHTTKGLLNIAATTGLREFMNVYGVGDHGGGPTRRDILRCHDMDTWPVYPRFKLTTSKGYFDLLERHGDKWPILDRELNFEFPGCYTSQSVIKRNNRLGEIYATQAEWAAVLGRRIAGERYPANEIEKIWRDVCFTHFHDILPGSGIAATRTYSEGMFQRLSASASIIRVNGLRAAAARIDTTCGVKWKQPTLLAEQHSVALGAGPGSGTMIGGTSLAGCTIDGPRPFVIFNPVAAERQEVVTAMIWDPQTGSDAGELESKHYLIRTADGQSIPAQKVNSGAWYWTNKFIEVAFPVRVGPMGYTTCVALDDGSRFREPTGAFGYGKVIKEAEVKGGVHMRETKMGIESMPVGIFAMENERLIVELDARSGGISKLIEKQSGINFADPNDPMGVIEFAYERPGGMTAWTIYDAYRQGNAEVPSLSRLSSGPWIASMQAKARAGNSEITITYTLKAKQRWVEIAVQSRWVEIGGAGVGTPRLSARFPMALKNAVARYEIPFGSIQRTENEGQEVPALRWADVTGTLSDGAVGGCALLNDCKYGHSLNKNTLRLSLLRSSYDPDPIPEVGDHQMRMALVPHSGELPVSELIRLGSALNEPLHVISASLHGGTLPAEAAAAVVTPDSVVLSAIKKAEDSEDLIFRLFETAGKPATAAVKLHEKLFGRVKRAVDVNFLEQDEPKSAATVIPGGFEVRLRPHSIASVKVTFE